MTNQTAQHRLSLEPTQRVVTHQNARPLAFGMMDGSPMLFMEFDKAAPQITLPLRMVRSGDVAPVAHEYIGTALQAGGWGWHLYVPANQIEDGRFTSAPPAAAPGP